METDAFCNTSNGLPKPLDLAQSFCVGSFSPGAVYIALFMDAISMVNSCIVMITDLSSFACALFSMQNSALAF